MNAHSYSKFRTSIAGLAVAAGALAAIPAAMADSYGRPYYDPARDVMVTPRVSSSSPAASTVGQDPSRVIVVQEPSQTASAPPRQPIYGTYYTAPRSLAVTAPATAIVQSSPGAVGGPTAVHAAAGSNMRPTNPVVAANAQRPYYDAGRDVMVTPTQSGTVPYTGSSRGGYGASSAQPTSTFELVVRNGRLIEGPGSIVVDHGSQVTMVVDSDRPEALRVDGYNLVAPVTPGQPLLLTFVAEQPGRFAYRLASGREIGVIEVGPPSPARMDVGMR